MSFSILNFFTIGIGPSSSHTVGPMLAAKQFIESLPDDIQPARIRCELYGSLAATGRGHHTDRALMLGFLGQTPETVDVGNIPTLIGSLEEAEQLELTNGRKADFDPRSDIVFNRGKNLPHHPNGMHFLALDEDDQVLHENVIYSLGGGFIASEEELNTPSPQPERPYPFDTAADLLAICEQNNLTIAEVVWANEKTLRPEEETRQRLDKVWQVMQDCVQAGCQAEGVLPGRLKVSRRAPQFHQRCLERENGEGDPLGALDWVNLFALAVNEENAAGGRVVTAPTNGAAGIIPAVLHYATRFHSSPLEHPVHDFLMTAGAIAHLYKKNASLSGADVGCQGEVGVACSMASGALAAYLGATPVEVEGAAEIGMEHNLGLTCDPIGGLVQIPCIERNAMASVKAINAARMAMTNTTRGKISLDKVIATMLQTGRDMMDKYKETSRGGLAVNYTEC
ncbi:MAG: L-serine ammonia-lyase [Verrucomicrobiota bacterium JB023]|nr:L-serine ammonia-lyase [Verrucomicrobiota bacterium JB023]